MRRQLFTTICLIFLLPIVVKAQTQLSENAKISIMTTSPWSGASYALFGHTAIYVQDDSTGIDTVFNYGFFDSTQPFFMYNFIRGKTDYVLGVQSLEQFIEDYKIKGVEVVEQELNLSNTEKQKMWEALYINHLPENRKYRYNFLYDNCVTRPRDLFEIFTDGELIYPEDKREQTYRDLIHECVNSYPWIKFGIDLIIGSGADVPISLRQKMFLPVYLMNSLKETTIKSNESDNQPAILSQKVIVDMTAEEKHTGEWSIASPAPIAFAILLLSLLVSFGQIKSSNTSVLQKIYDTIIFGIIGAGGMIIFFLSFFSEHPVTDSNWNFIWMNLFALIIPIFIWLKQTKSVVNIYHFINFVVLMLFLLFWWLIPQQLPFASIPFSMSLMIRSGSYIVTSRRNKIANNNNHKI